MGHAKRNKLVFTVKDKCRVCYTCVRECPVKAIKIINGQAEVLSERCIGCGNCVTVCSQKAKVFLQLKNEVEALLENKDNKVIACLAPSFPAEFAEIDDHMALLGMIRKLGFYKILDVAFGADLVAEKYKNLQNSTEKKFVSSDCPAVVFYIEQFHPELVSNIAPLASPLVATARLAKKIYGNDIKIVFLGPCVAKKAESDEVDEALTFRELRELFDKYNITPENTQISDFDGPKSGMGAIFPLSRGLLQTANKSDSIVEGKIIVDSGKNNFREAIKEFETGEIGGYHLELLCCDGCIMGPGMTEKNKHYFKRAQISKYVKEKLQNMDEIEWEKNMQKYRELDLSQRFVPNDKRSESIDQNAVETVLQKMGKISEKDHLNCGACGYDTCLGHANAVVLGYAEDEMCLPFTIEKLHNSIDQLNLSNETLKNTKLALKHSEKLANMGQISAGIAHELNNPLGVITMYSNILKDELKNNQQAVKDVELIVEQAHRCKNIVSGLLNFARKNKIKVEEVDVNAFIQRCIDSLVIPDNIEVNVQVSTNDPYFMIDYEQMMQAFTNLAKNAVEAMPNGGKLSFIVTGNEKNIEVVIKDTGMGIKDENMDKLFTPFFTTKEIGKGTGLGLPLVYGIIKMHNGKIRVNSNADPDKGQTGTEFIINLPRII